MFIAVSLCSACAAILGFGDVTSEGGGVDADVDGGLGRRCAVGAPFEEISAPLFEHQIVGNIYADRQGIHLSQDETQIYFSLDADPLSSDGGGDGHNWYLRKATRGNRNEKFGEHQPLDHPLNGFYTQRHPTLDNEETMIFFAARGVSGYEQLYYATRDARSQPFRPPLPLPAFVNTPLYNLAPFLYTLPDGGKELWYSHRGDGDASSFALWHTRIGNDDLTAPTFGEPEVLDPTERPEFAPVLSADGLELYFSREEGDLKVPDPNIWMAHRASPAEPFVEPKRVDKVNTGYYDRPGWLSPDGCRLYFLSSRDNKDSALNVYVAERR